MSVYSGRHHIRIHSSRTGKQDKIPYQRTVPTFDVKARVKLPPIIKNELLTGRDRKATLQPATCPIPSQVSACFPEIIETQPPRSWNQNGTASRLHANKRAYVNHLEKSPTQFPNSYAVLPPIGQTRSWQSSGPPSSVQAASPRNGQQAPIIIPDQDRGQRRRSSQRKHLDNGLSPSPNARDSIKGRTERIKSLATPTKNTQINTATIEQGYEKALCLPDVTYQPRRKTDAGGHNAPSGDAPSLSNEDVEMFEWDPIHVLEKLELSKETKEFLKSNCSQRRGGKCVEIDPSLKTAVDIIRDNLLRQTMEELCMMW